MTTKRIASGMSKSQTLKSDYEKNWKDKTIAEVNAYIRKLEAVAEKMMGLYKDTYHFAEIDQCWRCGKIGGGHGYKVGGNVCEFKALEDLEAGE